MAAQVLSFFQRSPRYQPAPADWSQQELAEFYRVESALIRAGIRVGTDRGMSDENEPWFVFYRSDDGEVVIHFARIDGEYIIAGPAYEEIARGFDFSSLVRNMVARHPLIRRTDRNDNISIHPAALLVAVVGTAFFKTGEARAAESGAANPPTASRAVLLTSGSKAGLTTAPAQAAPAAGGYTVQLPVNQAVLIMAAAMMASDYRIESASLAPEVRDALAATAAALDFGGPASAPLAGGGAFALSGGARAELPAQSQAQTVSSVLTLVALLSTLPAPEGLTTAQDANLGYLKAGSADSTLPGLSLEAAHWAIDVHLNSDALRGLQAVDLVRGIVGEANFQKISVIEVAKLPEVLAQLIDRGAHYTVTPEAPSETPPPPSAEPTSPTGAPPTSVDPTPVDPTPPSSGGSVTPPASGDTITVPKGGPDPAPSQPVTPSPAPPLHSVFASPELVKDFISYFVAHTDHVSILVKGLQVVIYDDRLVSDPRAIDHMTSMNFDFFDGTSVSLVGDQSAFLQPAALHY